MTMKQIQEAKQALSDKFNIPINDIVAIPYKGGTAVIDGRVSCEHRGSYNDIMAASLGDYEVTIGGRQYDTRKAMDWGLYKTFAEQAKEKPDIDTWTILTGEPLTELMKHIWGEPQVGFGGWRGASVRSYLRSAGSSVGRARPRLAVILGDLNLDASSATPSALELSELQANTEALKILAEALSGFARKLK